MQQGREYDAWYNASLSADAIPAILQGLPSMSLIDQCRTKQDLHIKFRELGEVGDLRSLSYSRKSAFYLLRENDPVMHRIEGCPTWIQIGED